ncbi:protein DELAY OF GERMINATION 1-like [Pyrus x bretschneideri]|uniref:protein DELAY OF GERMINATION 1-like n=1 Tax=Pyrus x bretschneideri TaxID=225117 RepID=UPI0020308248|nr:protein DELAY OF GERMINATION 1-like [Pyrus x bretschneideri]
MASGDKEKSKSCFKEWMEIQEKDLSELLQALTLDPQNKDTLKHLAQKGIDHFQEYIDKRKQLARRDASAFFASTWCTSWENSLLWIAGCRPSLFFRLVYVPGGSKMDSRLDEFLQGTRESDLGELLTYTQLVLVNSLQSKTISRVEETLTAELAALQEEIADQPIVMIAKGLSETGEMNREVEEALDEHGIAMVRVMEKADQLRLNTLKELVKILTPVGE